MFAPSSNAPAEKDHFFRNINNIIQRVNKDCNKNIIVGGDMNILMNVELDRDGGNPRYNVNAMNQVYHFLESCDLTLVLLRGVARTPQRVFAMVLKIAKPRVKFAPVTLKFILSLHFSETISNLAPTPGVG